VKAMVSEGEYLNALGEKLNEVSSVVQAQSSALQSLGKEMTEIKSKKQELPTYFGSKEQIHEELERQGVFAEPEEGLQDDFNNAFRMFTEVSARGDLVPGLQIGGHPASLMDLYQTMDLRGLVWNYGVGWISALKGGWNSAIGAKRKEAEDYINDLRKRRIEEILKPEKEKAKDFLEYTQSLRALEKEYRRESDELAFYNKTRKNEFNTKVNGMKLLEKDTYLKLLKIKNEIKDFKAQQIKPHKSTKEAFKEYLSYKVVV
jgi:hypothetical protein